MCKSFQHADVLAFKGDEQVDAPEERSKMY